MGENNKPTIFFALGGIEEIGKNMYIIEHDDEIIIIDCGNKFSDESVLPGVSSIVCPFNYLIKNKQKIKALIITHAHEDHIGGVPFLLKTIDVPVVMGSLLVQNILKRKLKEHPDAKLKKFIEMKEDTVFNTKQFHVDCFRVCHSIPLCYGLCINTPNGNIVTCGDFRFDFSQKMEQTNIHKISNIAQRGVDLLLCETTNAETPGFSPSEALVLDEIKRQICKAPGRVLVTTFASNLRRIQNIIEIAINLNRKICIIGKTMDDNIHTSITTGLIKTSKTDFIEPSYIKEIMDKELLIILTGSQGEPSAALNMMAEGKYPHIILKPTDTLLFSSNPIPGNFQQVETLINKLYKKGIRVVENSPSCKLHASGHATQTELELMIKLVAPKYIIPIHGEYKMLSAMEHNINFLGLNKERYIQVTNGQKVYLIDHTVKATDQFVDTSDVYIDGNRINENSSQILAVRKVLGTDGIFNTTIVIDRKAKKIIGLPVLITRGCFYVNTSIPLIKKISYSIKENIEKEIASNQQQIDDEKIKKIIENTILFFVWKNKNKKPLVRVCIFDYKS